MRLGLPKIPPLSHRLPQAAVLANAVAWLAPAGPAGAADNPHSRRVALLKRLLPTIGLALLLLIALWPQLAPLWQRMRLAFPAIDLREARELRMLNPRYVGVDRLGRPFVVTAAIGRQAPDRQDLMSMDRPRADIKIHNDEPLVVTAATGVYQSQVQMLDLFGEVTLVHHDGTQFVTDSARVDVANSAAEGTDPVTGHGPSGDVNSAGFRIIDKGAVIVFTGKSDMVLHPAAKADTASRTPTTLPPAVAAAAARTEAEAKPVLAAAKPPPSRRQVAPGSAASGHTTAQKAAHKPAAQRSQQARHRPAPAKSAPVKSAAAKPSSAKPVTTAPDKKT